MRQSYDIEQYQIFATSLQLVMQHIIAFILIVCVSSCKIRQPQFRGVDNYRVERNGLTFKLGTDVVFFNPNRVRFKLQNLAANVTLNNKTVATIGEQVDINVKGKQEFRIPVSISFKADDNVMDNLGMLLDVVKKREIILGLSGNIKFRAYCFIRKDHPFHYSKSMNFNAIGK